MKLSDAALIAGSCLAHLCPHCDKITVAGSIRRKKKDVKDIEIVCIPKEKPVFRDLFNEDVKARDPAFIHAVNAWNKVKGDPIGRYTQREIPDDERVCAIKLDLFMCVPDNFGLMLAIRTGPADYSHHVIAEGAHKVGMKIQGGMLTQNGELVPVPDEETLYKHLRIPYLPPGDRS